ncbi:hypothetical protein HDU98_000583 [Podochytrium sp. JEL0797]|nr:hypothetical protein HDU98_000583 [Podochytrium sp. JEL0797]
MATTTTTTTKTVTLVAMGSRGDIQPALGLSLALCALPLLPCGSPRIAVTLIVPENYYAWVSSALASPHATVLALPSNAEQSINTKRVADRVVKGDNTVLLRAMSDPDQMERDMVSLTKWCRNTDLMIVSAMSVPAGAILHEAYGLNVVQMPMFPAWYEITAEFPPMVDLPSLGSILNILLYYIATTAMWLLFKPTLDKMRATVNLEPITWWGVKNCMAILPTHHTWSPILHAKPKDWLESTSIGGFVFYETPSDTLDHSLERFLSSGPPPVYIGFGSMPIHLSTKFIPLIKDLLSSLPSSTRLIVYAGGMSNVASSDESRDALRLELLSLDPTHTRLYVTYSVPQRLLFPRCSMIVHHGGCGTTGEALRSGQPSMACPLIGDQFFWARRIAAVGVGPRLGRSFKRLDGRFLAGRIMEVLGEQGSEDVWIGGESENKYVVRAKEVGEMIRAEKGMENAVDFVVRHANRNTTVESGAEGEEDEEMSVQEVLPGESARTKLNQVWESSAISGLRLKERASGRLKAFMKKRQ